MLSSLWFGILLLLRAILAQSAPNNNPIYSNPTGIDEDEEELIDKLAEFVAMGRPDLNNNNNNNNFDFINRQQQQSFGGPSAVNAPIPAEFMDDNNNDLPLYSDTDFDLPSIDYTAQQQSMPYGGAGESLSSVGNDVGGGIGIGPKSFAYKPSDIRFYIPPEEFPAFNSQIQQQQEQAVNQFNTELELEKQLEEKSNKPAKIDEKVDNESTRNQVPPHMKKNQDEAYQEEEDVEVEDKEGVFNEEPIAQPGNIMASMHAADKPAGGPYISSFVGGQNTFSIYYVALIAALSSAGVVGLVGAGICWYRIHERVKAAAEVDYPAYGVTGPSKDVSPTGGDRKLAQSAHMYHYQHQKQQMAALQKSSMEGAAGAGGGGEKQGSDCESDDDNEEGDYTVYECPGLAPAGDMEVKNPLFQDETTPATPTAMPTEVAEDGK